MTLPNFLIIGAMKAGTTSLHRYMADHPEVFMASPKELHFFSHRDARDIDWYEEHFAAAGAAIAIGEASASYTTYPDSVGVSSRVAARIPDARLIYLVRQPIERMRSHYLHRVGAGKETAPIDEALLANPIYVETSRYGERLREYLEHFPRERIMIVRSEALRDERDQVLRRIYRFIGVDDGWVPTSVEREFYRTADKRVPRPSIQSLRRRPTARRLARRMPSALAKAGRRLATQEMGSEAGGINPDLRARLEDVVRDDVRRLRDIVGDGFDGWGIA
jgi:hypothetical protein